MDIHKPRPWHGWREFLKELGTIALGVSIALAAEQAVEKWRDHRQHLEAREAMNSEIYANQSLMQARSKNADCNSRRLDEIVALLGKAKNHQSFAAPSWIGMPISVRLEFDSEAEISRSGLFSPEEQRVYGVIYSYMRAYDLDQDRQRQAWSKLEPLQGEVQPPLEMIQALRMAVADARFEADRIKLTGDWANFLIKRNIPPTPTGRPVGGDPGFAPPSIDGTCLPLDTPREKGLSLTAFRFYKFTKSN